MKSLKSYIMNKSKNLSMIITYTFGDDDNEITDDFIEMLEEMKFKKADDQSTYELTSIHRSTISKIEKTINDWIKDNLDYINEGSHITMYKPIMVQNKYTDERYPVIKETKWEK